MPKVVVLGGGVAGLSAAHELVERGFTVEVYERGAWGGKARSIDHPVAVGTPLPAEHGFRFFPGFYTHIIDTMRRIPIPGAGGASVFPNNFAIATEITIAQAARPPTQLPAGTPVTIADWVAAIGNLVSGPNLGVGPTDAGFFASRIACFLSSGDQRRLAEYEGRAWFDFIGAARSPQYERIVARGLTHMLVAMRPDQASTRTVGTILVQLLIDILDPTRDPDRLLTAPTNDAWITPWVNFLTASGVQMNLNREVQTLNFNAAGITGVQFTDGTIVTGDYYVVAVPVEVAQRVIPDALKAQAGIIGMNALNVSWMNGVLFYLDQPIELSHGHAIYVDSPWAITGISQQGFWAGVNLATYGAGNVRGILSTIVSDWDAPGNIAVDLSARQCTRQQIIDEVWAQLVAHHQNAAPAARLNGIVPIDSFLDPAITPAAGAVLATNDEPLLINTVNSWQNRPTATTAVPNLFLASDYVQTTTDLATMEGANEAARRAVNGIIAASGIGAPPCVLNPLTEPGIFAALRAQDDAAFLANPATPAPLCSPAALAQAVAQSVAQSVPAPNNSTFWKWFWIILIVLLVIALIVVFFLVLT